MSAVVRVYTADERRLQARDDAMHEMLFITAGQSGLSHDGEMAIRTAVGRVIEPLLQLADSAVAALSELEAVDAGLTRHVLGCRVCRPEQPCSRQRFNLARRERLMRAYDAAYRSLVGRR